MVIRVLALGDNQRDPRSRAAEHDRVMDFIAEQVETMRPDVVAHAGDWTERPPIHEDRAYLFAWARRICAVCPLVGVEGNHEEPKFCDEFAHLDVAHPIVVATAPRVEVRGGVAFALMPWPMRGLLMAFMESRGMETRRESVDLKANELLQDVLRQFGAEFAKLDAAMPRVLVIHAEPAEYRLGADQPMHVAPGMRVAVEDMVLLTGADAVFVGHIHRPDVFHVTREDGVRVPVLLIGSPRRTAYAKGELEPKGVVVLTFDGRVPTWERIATPATPMMLVERAWNGTDLDHVEGSAHVPDRGAEIRLRYTVPSDARDAARRIAQGIAEDWISRGAAEVKLDEVVLAETRARAPEVAAATTVRGAVEAVWAAQGESAPPAECRPRLLERAEAVAAEGAAA